MKIKILFPALFLCFNLIANEYFPTVEGLTLKGDIAEYDADNLWNIIDGAADKYLRFNFEKLYFGIYTDDNGNDINVYIYQHADLNNAFGIYTQERNDDFITNGIGTEGYTIHESVNFFRNNFYVKLYSNTKGTALTIEKLAKQICKALPGDNSWSGLLNKLPKENKLENSESFIPTNYMGLGFMPPVFEAKYKSEEDTYQVFIIERESASDCQAVIKDYLAFAKQSVTVDENTPLSITDKYNGVIILIWKGNMIYGISGEPSENITSVVANNIIGL